MKAARTGQTPHEGGNVGTVFGIGLVELVIILLVLMVPVAVLVGLVVWLVRRS